MKCAEGGRGEGEGEGRVGWGEKVRREGEGGRVRW
jgi:hypothetical protein